MKGVSQRKKHLNTPQLWRSCRTSHDSRSRNRAKRINTQRGDKQRAQNNRTEHAALRAHKKRGEKKEGRKQKKETMAGTEEGMVDRLSRGQLFDLTREKERSRQRGSSNFNSIKVHRYHLDRHLLPHLQILHLQQWHLGIVDIR